MSYLYGTIPRIAAILLPQQDSGSLKISTNEWLHDLELARKKQKSRSSINKLTKEQVDFLRKARENETPLSWEKIEIIFNKYFFKLSDTTLRVVYDKLKENNFKLQ